VSRTKRGDQVSCQVRKRDGVHVIAKTQHVVSCVKDDSNKAFHVEFCAKPFKVLEIFIPDGRAAFYLYVAMYFGLFPILS